MHQQTNKLKYPCMQMILLYLSDPSCLPLVIEMKFSIFRSQDQYQEEKTMLFNQVRRPYLTFNGKAVGKVLHVINLLIVS